MFRVTLSFAALAALAHPSPAAVNNTVLRGPPPAWAKLSEPLSVPADAAGMVFVRRNDQLMHLDATGQAGFQGYRLKILHPNALQLGNLAIVWNPSAGAPTIHTLKIYRGSSVIDVLATTNFEILRREGQLEAAALDGNLTAVLRVPDLRVGDELEFAATIRDNDPTLGTSSAGLLALPPELAPGRYHLGINWEAGQEPRVKLSSDLARVAQRDANGLSVRLDNPISAAVPTGAPVRFAWARVVEYSDYGDWQSVSRRFAPMYQTAARLSPNSPLKAEASKIAAANPDDAGRVAAALKLVQQDVRYIYVGLEGGNYRPSTADETWQRRYGDCKAKTALLLALLGELGIEAEPVLANNSGAGDGTDARLPSPALFDHVLVRAKAAGKLLWLDGTLPTAATPSTEPALPYRWILPLHASGRTLEEVKWKPATIPDEITLWDMDARTGFDKPARITATFVLRGIKGLQQFASLSALTPAQLLSSMRQEMVGNTWQEIDKAEWRYDPSTRASIVTVSGKGVIDWRQEGNERSLVLPGGGFNPPDRLIRTADQDQKPPYATDKGYSCDVTTVHLPSGTKPEKWSTNSQFDTRIFGRNYYRAFDRTDTTVSMVRGLRTERNEIAADEAARENSRVASFDNSMAVLTFDPTAGSATNVFGSVSGGGRPSRGRVPAIPSFDWTGADAPCVARTIALAK